MSFQAYIDNIKTKTGKTPAGFKKLAIEKGFLKKGNYTPTVAMDMLWPFTPLSKE